MSKHSRKKIIFFIKIEVLFFIKSELSKIMNCNWCKQEILNNHLIIKNPLQHVDWLNDILQNYLPIRQASEDITSVIMSFLYEDNISQGSVCHKSCLDFTSYTTRSGRKTGMVRRIQDEIYTPGSGVAGCDSFDHRFDHGVHHDWEKNRWTEHLFSRPQDEEFVVEECVEPLVELPSDISESEWEDEDSTDEESDEDWA